MKREDRIQLENGFKREDWIALWDRLPERARKSTVLFVLQKLHAIESQGNWSASWHYVTNEEREESDGPMFDDDQPGDIITFKGSMTVGPN